MERAAPPLLDGNHPVRDAVVEEFRRDGHCMVPGLASEAEVEQWRPLIERVAMEAAWDKRPLEERDTYGKAFLQSLNLWKVNSAIAQFSLAPRFASVAAQLLGVDAVRIYHDQALLKEPGGGPTPWHQDQYYWPLDTDRSVTMWMPLVDLPSEVGSMTFVSGSHLAGDLRGRAISDESDAEFAELVDSRGLPTATHGALEAGDATFHAGWTIHSAGANPSEVMRTVMTVIYVADGARVATDLSEARELDRMLWLGGAEPGELIQSELNPVVWP